MGETSAKEVPSPMYGGMFLPHLLRFLEKIRWGGDQVLNFC